MAQNVLVEMPEKMLRRAVHTGHDTCRLKVNFNVEQTDVMKNEIFFYKSSTSF